ncbi:MAG: hydrogenase maturation protease [Candidatus Binatia bacterium]
MTVKTLIIGYGNPLRGDDGVAWHAAQALAAVLQNAPADVMTCHQLTPELAEPVSRADLVVFIDAEQRQPAGKIFSRRVKPDEAPLPAFSHDFTPATLIAWTRRLYQACPEAILFSVAGSSFECAEELSPPVAAALPELIERVCAWVRAGETTRETRADA